MQYRQRIRIWSHAPFGSLTTNVLTLFLSKHFIIRFRWIFAQDFSCFSFSFIYCFNLGFNRLLFMYYIIYNARHNVNIIYNFVIASGNYYLLFRSSAWMLLSIFGGSFLLLLHLQDLKYLQIFINHCCSDSLHRKLCMLGMYH